MNNYLGLPPVQPSTPKKGNQIIIEKYTKLVMDRLYNSDVQVFFEEMWDYRALYRPPKWYPYHTVSDWDPTKPNITFHTKIFREDEPLPPHTWRTLVHEVTHHSGDLSKDMVMCKNGALKHTPEFTKRVNENLRKVKDLKKQFLQEVEIDEHW